MKLFNIKQCTQNPYNHYHLYWYYAINCSSMADNYMDTLFYYELFALVI